MQRLFTKDATGTAPNGRLYAGDINALQDAMAALTDFFQTLSVGVLRVGEAGLQLVRFGTNEARLTGALRTDGILRGLGGIYFGAYTNAQRNAIATGSRPFGLHIFNTDTGQLEYNAGTDPSPVWQPVTPANAQLPIGSTMDWPWIHTSIPSNFLMPYGQAISRTAYPALNALAAATGYIHGAGDGSTTFNMPDYRGRQGVGRDDMGGAAAGRITAGGSGVSGATLGAFGGAETITLSTGQLPAHSHGLSGSVSNGSLATGVGSLSLPNHVHALSDPGHTHSVYDPGHAHAGGVYQDVRSTPSFNPSGAELFAGNTAAAVTGIAIYGAGTGMSCGGITTAPAINGAPSLSGSISNGTLATTNTGSGTAVNNVAPVIIVNKIMRVL